MADNLIDALRNLEIAYNNALGITKSKTISGKEAMRKYCDRCDYKSKYYKPCPVVLRAMYIEQ